MLQITQRRQEGTLIAVYTGELDHHAARAAIEQTEDLLVLFPCEKLVLDLSELTFMDSSGLAVVLHLYRTCARSGREFAVRGTPPQPQRVQPQFVPSCIQRCQRVLGRVFPAQQLLPVQRPLLGGGKGQQLFPQRGGLALCQGVQILVLCV